jgi:glycosyltransferase involved in cell wall biosynthesis
MMQRCKCLFVAHTFPPVAAVGIFRTLRFLDHLPEYGWEGLALSCKEDAVVGFPIDHTFCERIPPGTIVERVGVWRPLDRFIEGVKRMLAPSRKYSGEASLETTAVDEKQKDAGGGFFARLKQWFSGIREIICYTPDECANWIGPAVIAGCRMVRRYRPQVVLSTGPPHSAHLAALGIHLITRTPLILDLRDPWASDEWAIKEDHKIKLWLQKKMEKLCVRFAARVVLNTERLRHEFLATYPKRWASKFVAIPNGVDRHIVEPVQRFLSKASESQEHDTRTLCHPGNIYKVRSLAPLVHAVRLLKESGDRVLLEQIGQVNSPPNLAELLIEWDLSEVRLCGRQSHETTLQRMAAADILVVVQPLSAVQVPAKLYEMLLFRKPILVLTDEGATADVIRKYGIGVLADPTNADAIAMAIRQLDQLLRNGEPPGDWDGAIAAYDSHHLAGDLVTAMEETISKERASR